ncbi:MAG: hypothetical protein OXP66_08635 [Candidatus Tectomicrobia bacterium]|nr:hypothetical protein [Candidatus Tectomicrobia bacterium]
MRSARGFPATTRLRWWRVVLPLIVAFVLVPGSVSFGQPAAEFRARTEAAVTAAEAALVVEEARLDELAEHHVSRTLEDGTPSAGQALSNIRLSEQRIREFEASELDLRQTLDRTLAGLDLPITQLVERLSAQRDQRQERTTQQQAERGPVQQRKAEGPEGEQERVEREPAESGEAERNARALAARRPPGLQWLKSAGEVPRDALIGGRFNSEPVHVCRDVLKDGIYVGVLYSGSHSGNCYVGWRGGHRRGGDFEVLTGVGEIRWIEINENFVDPRLLTADSVVRYGEGGFSLEATGGLEQHQSNPDAWYVFRGGQQANGVPIFICAADHDSGPKPGGVVDGNCHFEYSGEQVREAFRVLVVKGWAETLQDARVRRDESLAARAVRNIETRALDSALDAIARMRLGQQRDQLLDQIAQAQIEDGSLRDALGTAKLISAGNLRNDVLNQVAMAHLQAGHPQEAAPVAILMQTGKLRDDMLGRVADKHREAWRLGDALGVAGQIGNDGSRRRHLYNLAMAQIEARDYEGAMNTAQLSHAPGNDYRDRVLGTVVDKYRESWKLPEALAIAGQIQRDDWRRKHLYNVAMAQIAAADYDGAMGTVQLSHAPGNDYRDRVFGTVVDKYRESWKLPEALGIAERIHRDDWRRKHLYNVAMAQIAAGDYEGAMGTAQLSHAPGNDYRDRVFGTVVDEYREAGRFQKALSIAEQIYRDGWRRNHLHNIARGQVDAGDQESAKATASRIEDPRLRDKVLSEIAQRASR